MLMHFDEQKEPAKSKELLRAEALKSKDFFPPVKVSVIYFQVLILFITKNEQNSFPKAGWSWSISTPNRDKNKLHFRQNK